MFGLYMFIFVDTLYKYKFGFYQTISGNATNFLHFDMLSCKLAKLTYYF